MAKKERGLFDGIASFAALHAAALRAARGKRSKPGAAAFLANDFALFHDDPAVLRDWRTQIAAWLEGRRLRLHPRKTVIVPTGEPAQFLGFVLLADGRRRLPDDNVRRFRNRLRGLRDRWRHGSVTREEVQRRVGSWIAHAEHANTRRLRRSIFRAGWLHQQRRVPRCPHAPWPEPAALRRRRASGERPGSVMMSGRGPSLLLR